MRRTLLVCLLLGLVPDPARAQAGYTTEELRDLARPVTPGAATLALGGTRGSGLGDATDAAFNPASLVLGPRADATFSIGAFRYAREELQRTPVAGRTFEDSVVTVDAPARPIGSVAAAFRGRRFAVGASYDAVSRLDYARDVDRVRWQTGAQLLRDSRQWSLGIRHQRFGAAFGAVLPGELAAVGVAVHAARMRMRYAASGINSEALYNTVQRVYNVDGSTENLARLDTDAWNLGLTVGALVRPHPRVDVSVRYAREPKASVVLEGSQLSWRAGFESFRSGSVAETHAFLDQPDVVSGAATVHAGAFRVVGEAGAVLAAGTFRDERPRTGDYCGATANMPLTESSSRSIYPCWSLTTWPKTYRVTMPNGPDVRVGVERGWDRPGVSGWLRGGVSRETTAMLQPPDGVTDSFLPPRSSRIWLHLGGGLRVGRLVTDLGVARWERQYRVLVDLRVSTAGSSRTLYGSHR